MLLTQLQNYLSEIREQIEGEVSFNQPLSKYTYYRIGGEAEVLVTPKSENDLLFIFNLLKNLQFQITILGAGSNVLISDHGLSGVVIRTQKLNQILNINDCGSFFEINVGSGVSISQLVKEGAKWGWDGVQALVGIPGLVGGMIAMNAGTHLGEIKDFVKSLKYFDFKQGKIISFEVNRNDLSEFFAYRTAKFLKPTQLITEIVLEFPKADPLWVESKISEIYQRRKNTQPIQQPSCGSVFKNPDDTNKKSWQVIDELGLRGFKIGNAQISEKHSNFIVNLGNAKASDVFNLIKLVKEKAALNGILLEEEVKILGSFDNPIL